MCRLGKQGHLAKTSYLLKDILCLWRVPIKFYIRYPWQMYLPSISCINYIVLCLTSIRQPLKSFNRLAVSHTVPPLGIIPTVSCCRNNVRNTLLQMDDIVINCPKGSILTNFKNKFLKAQHACLSTLTSSIQ